MFENLKKKISGWFGKKTEELASLPEKVKLKERKKSAKEVKKKKEIKKKIKTKKKVEKKICKKKEEVVEEKLKKEADKIAEEVPLKFDVGKEKYEPDLEVIGEKLEELEEISEKGKEGIEFETKGVAGNEAPRPPIQLEFEEKFEEVKERVVEKEGGFFARLKKKLSTSVLKQEEFDEIFEELEFILLENNVALEVVDKIKEELGKDLVGISVKKGEVEKIIKDSLKKAIESVLIEGKDLIKEIEKSLDMPYVILFFGINGSGKTTSVAKLAWKLKEENVNCVLAAGDTFRAASIEQLEIHANKIGVPIVKGEYGKDPASVAFDAISYAKKHKIKVVLIDTAGRMYTKQNLMKEMEKIVRVSKPNKKIFVGESITGNDATEQARMFNETAGIDGIILTKADVDERAGAILSVSYATGKPILFLGTGQEYKDLEKFEKRKA